MRWLLFVVLIGACHDPERTADPVDLTDHVLPTFAPIPPPNADVAQPQAFAPDGRPVLLLFTASWCQSCFATLLTDAAIARAYRDRFQVGVGLVEDSDVEFARSPMARLLAGVPVWTAASVRELATRCGAAAIPMACLVDHGRIVFHGPAVTAQRLLDAYDGNFDAAAGDASVLARLPLGVATDDIPGIVAATHADPGLQNAIAWQLATRRDASPTDVALAVALAHDVVTADGGLDYAHLDTYQLALSKANLADAAATVSWRVLAVCAAVHSDCMIERRRAYAFIYYARNRRR